MEQCALTETQREQVEQWLCNFPGAASGDLLNGLSYNLRRVIQLRYGLADGHRYSVEETATIFGKSMNWVVEIESGAIILLYEFLAPAGALHNS